MSFFYQTLLSMIGFQPEFYEDTKTYISKRTSQSKNKKAMIYIKKIIFLLTQLKKFFC